MPPTAAPTAMPAIAPTVRPSSPSSSRFWTGRGAEPVPPSWLVLACLAAFAVSTLGRQFRPKLKLEDLRWITAALLAVAGAGLAAGLI